MQLIALSFDLLNVKFCLCEQSLWGSRHICSVCFVWPNGTDHTNHFVFPCGSMQWSDNTLSNTHTHTVLSLYVERRLGSSAVRLISFSRGIQVKPSNGTVFLAAGQGDDLVLRDTDLFFHLHLAPPSLLHCKKKKKKKKFNWLFLSSSFCFLVKTLKRRTWKGTLLYVHSPIFT